MATAHWFTLTGSAGESGPTRTAPLERAFDYNGSTEDDSVSEKWMADHPTYLRGYYLAHREEHAARSRRNRYGLTAEQYGALLEAQGGACAICRQPESQRYASGMTRALAVDHDHSCCAGQRSCGQCLRGLLCAQCNTALARMRDDPALLRAAAVYLESFQCA